MNQEQTIETLKKINKDVFETLTSKDNAEFLSQIEYGSGFWDIYTEPAELNGVDILIYYEFPRELSNKLDLEDYPWDFEHVSKIAMTSEDDITPFSTILYQE